MGLACAALGWTGEQFWSATPHEYWAWIEVWKQMNVPEKSEK